MNQEWTAVVCPDERIDTLRKTMLRDAERLVSALGTAQHGALAALAQQLLATAREQFEAEERRLRDAKAPSLVRHAREHQRFLADLGAMISLASRGDSDRGGGPEAGPLDPGLAQRARPAPIATWPPSGTAVGNPSLGPPVRAPAAQPVKGLRAAALVPPSTTGPAIPLRRRGAAMKTLTRVGGSAGGRRAVRARAGLLRHDAADDRGDDRAAARGGQGADKRRPRRRPPRRPRPSPVAKAQAAEGREPTDGPGEPRRSRAGPDDLGDRLRASSATRSAHPDRRPRSRPESRALLPEQPLEPLGGLVLDLLLGDPPSPASPCPDRRAPPAPNPPSAFPRARRSPPARPAPSPPRSRPGRPSAGWWPPRPA